MRWFVPLAVGVLAAGALVACAAPSGAPVRPDGTGSAPVASVTDVAWAQLTIALDERALRVLDLVRQRGTDPRLIAFAADLASGHRTEVAEIGAELRLLGVSGENPHAKHEMPGMASPETIAALAESTSYRVDQLAVRALRAHLDQCRTLAAGELQSGSHARLMQLARAIDAARKNQLEALAQIPAASERSIGPQRDDDRVPAQLVVGLPARKQPDRLGHRGHLGSWSTPWRQRDRSR